MGRGVNRGPLCLPVAFTCSKMCWDPKAVFEQMRCGPNTSDLEVTHVTHPPMRGHLTISSSDLYNAQGATQHFSVP